MVVTLEERLWQNLVKGHLVADTTASLPKKQQQALANALQEWTATCIAEHLKVIASGSLPERWQIHHRGRDFLGGFRSQEVDVWMFDQEAGLVLAVDPKHFQSKASFGRNWKNGHNDLIAFATNLHERFPTCAIGGVIAFPEWAASAGYLKQIVGICNRSITREKPLNAYGKFEGFALAVYDTQGALVWPFKPNAQLLTPQAAFENLAKAVYSRTIALR